MPTPVGAVLRRTRPRRMPASATRALDVDLRAFGVDLDSHCEATRAFRVDSSAIRALGVDSCDLHS